MDATRSTAGKTSIGVPLLEAAMDILRHGWYPIPLCWPTDEGLCGCGRGHAGHDVGKAPLLGHDYQSLCPDERDVRHWWAQWPRANVGILLEPSNLLFVGPDNPESARWAARQPGGLPPTVLRFSHNPGYLYARPAGCPIAAKVKLKPEPDLELDIKSNGYAVACGRHQHGEDIYLDGDVAVPAPSWAVALLPDAQAAHMVTASLSDSTYAVRLRVLTFE